MNKYILIIFFLVIGNYAGAQCLTSSLVINTGYNPITRTAIAGGANGATAVIDPYWLLTAVSPATTAAIAATPIAGLVGVTPGNNADVVTPIGGSWVANPAGNPGNWISGMNSNTYNDQGTNLLYTMTFGRPFKMCAADNITLNLYVASDNFISSADIDGTIPLTLTGTGFNTYTYFTQTASLSAGTHTIHIVVNNQNIIGSVAANPTGLNVYGTVFSATGTNSMVSESYASCSTYSCGSTCNTISLPDSLHLCQGGADTLRATVIGTDSVLSIAWTPITGLSSSTVLRPLLTVGTTSGWYDITIQSLIPYNLVYNGDFSLGNTGFSSSYIYSAPPSTILNEGYYSVYNNPNGVHSGFISMGTPTGSGGNMLIVNGGGTPSSIWCETISVTPNTNYDFSAWFADCSSVTTGAYVPILQFMVNGVLLGAPTSVTAPPGTWVNFFATWNSGANTSATICIYDEVTTTNGNDFVIDDISFEQICVAKDSIYVDVKLIDTTYNNVIDSACATGPGITLTAPTGYSSYRWNTGSTGMSISPAAPGSVNWVYAGSTCAMFIDTFHVAVITPDTTTNNHATDSACSNVGSSITLTAPAGHIAYLWNTGATGQFLTVYAAGTYWVSSPGTCATFVDTFHSFFKPLPPAPHTTHTTYCVTFPGAPSLTTQVDSFTGTLNWYYSNWGPYTGNFNVPTDNVTLPGDSIWYVTQTIDGCPGDTGIVSVTIIPPPAITIIASSPWVCQFDSISLRGLGSPLIDGGFSWKLPAGASFANGTGSTDSLIYVQFDSANAHNEIYLTINNLYGQCSNNDSAGTEVIELPTASAYSKTDVCLSDTVSLSLSSMSENAINFNWYIDGSTLFSSPDATVIAANSNSGGPFSISWTDTGKHFIHVQAFAEHGCAGKPTSDTVMVHALPDASFNITTSGGTLCLEDSVFFSANDSSYQNNYLWLPAHSFNNIDKYATWGKVEQAQSIISLTVTDPFGCKSSSSKELDPSVCCNVLFPNAFSPNGDKYNNVFRPIPTGAYHQFHSFRIVNRWGQTVFEATDNRAAWDGTLNGVPQDIGVYYYYIKYDCGGKTLEQKGDVTLIR